MTGLERDCDTKGTALLPSLQMMWKSLTGLERDCDILIAMIAITKQKVEIVDRT